MDRPLKIAVSGKGGVGKTTVSAGLCHALADGGYEVLALDCDPDSNLAGALGFPEDVLAGIRPLSTLADLIEERTGSRPGQYGGMFKLNPQVADIPDSHCNRHGPFRLLAMDTINRGGGGCACPQNVLMRNVVGEVLVRRGEAVVLDMEAGLEHLGRATARAVSTLVAVVQPGRRSVGTARSVLRLAADIGIPRCLVLGNGFAPEDDFAAFAAEHGFDEQQVLGCVPHDPGIARADRARAGIAEMMAPETRDVFTRILERIEEVSRDDDH